MPDKSGSMRPPVSPKEWKMGRALNTWSAGLKSTLALSW